MRNTTKLKRVLELFTVSFDIDEAGLFKVVLFNKGTQEMYELEAESYSRAVAKSYSILLKTLKQEGL